MTGGRPGLLVSVRSVRETLSALEGGADLIDIKEPTRGPLGPADRAVVEEIVVAVDGQLPVSAAMGEWVDWSPVDIPKGVTFAKWGMSRLAEPHLVAAGRIRQSAGDTGPVLVAYADYQRAQSPDPDLLAWDASDWKFPVFLIDTAVKDGSTLLDWIDALTLMRIVHRLQHVGVQVAIGGSLDVDDIGSLAYLKPDWFAVRGAACDGGREGTISAQKVKRLHKAITESMAGKLPRPSGSRAGEV